MKPETEETTKWTSYLLAAVFVAALVAVQLWGVNAQSQVTPKTAAQKTFTTAADAGQALEAASSANDKAALAQILGPKSQAILSSGDAVEDKAGNESFAAKYKQMNRWVIMTDGSQVLHIGADNYAFPIPLAKNESGKWYFNTAAGEEEVLARRIGKNELLAIDACNALANAQQLYFQTTGEYAQRIISTFGKHDGLYWQGAEGQPVSPLDGLQNFADSAAFSAKLNGALVLDGYSFRILPAQGKAATGGPKNYIVNGKMTGGFAIVASPVKYLDSGVTTFILSEEGVLYEKDLGPNTSTIATSLKEFNPGEGWEKTKEAQASASN